MGYNTDGEIDRIMARQNHISEGKASHDSVGEDFEDSRIMHRVYFFEVCFFKVGVFSPLLTVGRELFEAVFLAVFSCVFFVLSGFEEGVAADGFGCYWFLAPGGFRRAALGMFGDWHMC